MNDWGFKIAETSNDVKTCEDNKLIFTSKYPALKIQSSGSGTIETTDVTGWTETIAEHNLGYRPFFIVWLDLDDGNGFQIPSFQDAGGTFRLYYFATSKENDLLIGMTSINTANELWEEPTVEPDSPMTIDYAYVIYYDPIEDE